MRADGCAKALPTQLRVIEALILREILARFGRMQAGYLWAFATPLAQVAALYLVWTLLQGRESSSMPLVLFLLTGVLPFWLFRQAMRQGATSANRNKQLLNLPPITVFDITIAHAVLEFLTMLLVFSVAVTGTRFIGESPSVKDPLGVLTGFALMWAIGTGLGMLFAGISTKFPSAANVAQPFLGRPLFFTSGLFFTADMIPASLRDWLLYNPLLHVTEYTRSSFFHEFDSAYYDLSYPAMFALSLWTIGHATMRINRAELSRQ